MGLTIAAALLLPSPIPPLPRGRFATTSRSLCSQSVRFPCFSSPEFYSSSRITLIRCQEPSQQPEEAGGAEENPKPKKPFFLTVDFWLQVAILVFALGFVDAGFSGDWSRIGVLTKETESELQMAAVGVVPLAAVLIWSISQRRKL